MEGTKVTKGTGRRNHQSAPTVDHLASLVEAMPGNDEVERMQALADEFGISRSGLRHWLNGKGPAPMWTVVAAEGVRARLGVVEKTPAVYVVKVPHDKITVFDQFVDAIDCTTWRAWG